MENTHPLGEKEEKKGGGGLLAMKGEQGSRVRVVDRVGGVELGVLVTDNPHFIVLRGSRSSGHADAAHRFWLSLRLFYGSTV